MPDNHTIEQLFDGIAPDYDRMNHLMSFNADRRWRRVAVRRIADTSEPLQVLDLATGTGDFAIAIAQKLPAGGHVTGIDLSEKMLELGRGKVIVEGLSERVDLLRGNAEQLSFADESFDRVSVAFGVRNYENLQKGLSEACRVLRRGGKLVVLELSYPDNRFLLWCYKLYALKVLPWLGGLVSGDRAAYTYLPESILRFPKGAAFMALLREAGFGHVTEKRLTFGVCRMYLAKKM